MRPGRRAWAALMPALAVIAMAAPDGAVLADGAVEHVPQRASRDGGVIIGTVTDATTGHGIAEAAVTLRGDGVALAIATDPLGRYYFVALPPGDYTITAARPSYGEGRFGQRRAGGPGQPLTLRTDEWRVDADVRLWPLATISGVVADEAGEGVVGARVNALRREHTGTGVQIVSIASELTDDRGLFRIGGLLPGEYLVMTPSVQVTVPVATLDEVAASGTASGSLIALLVLGSGGGQGEEPLSLSQAFENMVFVDERTIAASGAAATPPPPQNGQQFAYPSQYFPAVDIPALAMPVQLGAGDEFSGISFYLSPVPTASITGTVVGPAGPVDNQLLRLVPDTGEDFGMGFEAAATVSALDGRFRFPEVPSGSYLIEARSPRSLQALTPGAPPPDPEQALRLRSEEWWSRTPVSVHAIDVEDLTVAMRPTLSVAGHVVFESGGERPTSRAVESIRISLAPVAGGRAGVPDARPIATGAFAMHGLLPSRYYLDVTTPPGWFVESATSRGVDLTTDPLDASDAAETLVVSIRMTSVPARITGTVRDQRGFPATGTTVIVLPSSHATLPPLRTREVRVSSTGEFSIVGLPSGSYEIVAIDEAETGNWRDPAVRSALRGRAVNVALRPGEQRLQDLRVNWRSPAGPRATRGIPGRPAGSTSPAFETAPRGGT